MKSITSIIVAGTAALFLSACGGGGGSSSTPVDPMTERDAILIAHEIPVGGCADPDFQSYFISEMQVTGATDIIFRTETSSVSCATYGKEPVVSDTEGCLVVYYDLGTETCVIGFNIPTTSSSSQNESNILNDVSVLINNY